MSITTAPPLRAEQARKLEAAEIKAARLRAEADEAERERDQMRQLYKPRLPESDDPRDAGKIVHQAIAGGILVRVSEYLGGKYFGLKAYLEAGHPITPEMEPFVSQSPRERWTVKSIKGPKSSRAVEPT